MFACFSCSFILLLLFNLLLYLYYYFYLHKYFNMGCYLSEALHPGLRKHKLSKELRSMDPRDVRLLGWYTKTPPRVDLFGTFVRHWLAHPPAGIPNVVDDSRDLLEPNNLIQGEPLQDLTMRWPAQSGRKSDVGLWPCLSPLNNQKP
jgi:hypothetical protein